MTPHFRDHRDHADRLIKAALFAADPAVAVKAHWQELDARPTLLLAIGKASHAMGRAALDLLEVPELCGVVTVPPEYIQPLDKRIVVLPCDHPLPTDRNVRASKTICDSISAMHSRHGAQWQLLFMISGGGSAHLTLPAGTLLLEEVRAVTLSLQRVGADIRELNTVRKHIERLKGGLLAELAFPVPIRTLVLSDVIGNPLDVIASGPVSPDPTTYADALAVLDRHMLTSKHAAVARHLREGIRGRHRETPKPGNLVFACTEACVVASNSESVAAAEAAARSIGFRIDSVRSNITGHAATIARDFVVPITDGLPACRLLGGEPTVNVEHTTGIGGPSQELALCGAIAMDGREDHAKQRLALLAFSTDGIDGPTDAAGAIVTDETAIQLRSGGADPATALKNHDSYTALDRTGSLVRTGPTGTNVNHVAALFAYSPEP